MTGWQRAYVSTMRLLALGTVLMIALAVLGATYGETPKVELHPYG